MERLAYIGKIISIVSAGEFDVATTSKLLLNDSNIGDDVSDLLGCTKYEKPVPASVGGEIMRAFPSFIPKTDEINFQAARDQIEALQGKQWYATVKMDGSSGTIYKWQGEFGVCSCNWELRETKDNGFWQIARRYNLREQLPDGYAVQLELCGPGIQSNPMGLKQVDGFVFDVYDIENRRYLNRTEWTMMCELLGISKVLITASNRDFSLSDEELRKLAEGTYPNGKQREGIVVRSYATDIYEGRRVSFKVLNLLYKN